MRAQFGAPPPPGPGTADPFVPPYRRAWLQPLTYIERAPVFKNMLLRADFGLKTIN